MHSYIEIAKKTLYPDTEIFDQCQSSFVQAYALLMDIETCDNYIKELSQNLSNFHKIMFGTNPQTLNRENIEFVRFEKANLSYPKYTGDNPYIGIEKHHILSLFLINFFRRYGMATNCYKWSGFIPTNEANKAFMNGDYIVESRYGVSLFHGKYSHMIQQYIIIRGIEDKVITWDINKIKEFFMNTAVMKHSSNATIRQLLFDMRFFYKDTYSDPHKLSDKIMNCSHSLFLSDCLIDSFLKGKNTLCNAYLNKYNKNISDIFYKHFDNEDLHLFDKLESDLVICSLEKKRYSDTIFYNAENDQEYSFAIFNKTKSYENLKMWLHNQKQNMNSQYDVPVELLRIESRKEGMDNWLDKLLSEKVETVDNFTPMHVAVFLNDTTEVNRILETENNNINVKAGRRITPLKLAKTLNRREIEVRIVSHQNDLDKIAKLKVACKNYSNYLESKIAQIKPAAVCETYQRLFEIRKEGEKTINPNDTEEYQSLVKKYIAITKLRATLRKKNKDKQFITPKQRIQNFKSTFLAQRRKLEKNRDSVGIAFIKSVVLILSLGITYNKLFKSKGKVHTEEMDRIINDVAISANHPD